MFLDADAILMLAANITRKPEALDPKKEAPITFYPARIQAQLQEHLPFMATEELLVHLVQQGHDRQEMHALIEKHAHDAGKAWKEEGKQNDLFDRLADDPSFPMDRAQLEGFLQFPDSFAGAADTQTVEFIEEHVEPVMRSKRHVVALLEDEVKV